MPGPILGVLRVGAPVPAEKAKLTGLEMGTGVRVGSCNKVVSHLLGDLMPEQIEATSKKTEC